MIVVCDCLLAAGAGGGHRMHRWLGVGVWGRAATLSRYCCFRCWSVLVMACTSCSKCIGLILGWWGTMGTMAITDESIIRLVIVEGISLAVVHCSRGWAPPSVPSPRLSFGVTAFLVASRFAVGLFGPHCPRGRRCFTLRLPRFGLWFPAPPVGAESRCRPRAPQPMT